MITSLANTLLLSLQQKQQSISVAESFTGGLISYHLSAIPGASEVFYGSIVSYSNEAKNKLLFVPMQTIHTFESASIEVLTQMLEGCILQFHSDFAIASTGIAGPSGASKKNPIGTIYLGIMHKNTQKALYEFHLQGSRVDIQHQACKIIFEKMLDFLRTF